MRPPDYSGSAFCYVTHIRARVMVGLYRHTPADASIRLYHRLARILSCWLAPSEIRGPKETLEYAWQQGMDFVLMPDGTHVKIFKRPRTPGAGPFGGGCSPESRRLKLLLESMGLTPINICLLLMRNRII